MDKKKRANWDRTADVGNIMEELIDQDCHMEPSKAIATIGVNTGLTEPKILKDLQTLRDEFQERHEKTMTLYINLIHFLIDKSIVKKNP